MGLWKPFFVVFTVNNDRDSANGLPKWSGNDLTYYISCCFSIHFFNLVANSNPLFLHSFLVDLLRCMPLLEFELRADVFIWRFSIRFGLKVIFFRGWDSCVASCRCKYLFVLVIVFFFFFFFFVDSQFCSMEFAPHTYGICLKQIYPLCFVCGLLYCKNKYQSSYKKKKKVSILPQWGRIAGEGLGIPQKFKGTVHVHVWS